MKLNLDNSFSTNLPADAIEENYRRQVKNACYSWVKPRVPSKPKLIDANKDVAALIGVDVNSADFLSIFSGEKTLENSQPYAMCYGGHQFGIWAGQLGDGRAINLGEVINENQRWALQLKGAGETPYARNADGLAVLRSSIREHLCSEAMFHLGVPTTRSLSLIETGDKVLRDPQYNGNAIYEKGAVICRVANSFVRFGNFEILAANEDTSNLKLLADYVIKYFFPEIKNESKYIEWFRKIAQETQSLIINWQRVGFVHGVMNTDNMSILSQTIDYGPFGFLEGFDPNWTPNTTDSQKRRYRYANQLHIGLWNLHKLANAIYPLIEDAKPLEEILNEYQNDSAKKEIEMWTDKLGLETPNEGILEQLFNTLQLLETDMTVFFRNLSKIDLNNEFTKIPEPILNSIYNPKLLDETNTALWLKFLNDYRQISINIDQSKRIKKMNAVNPKYILRNYMAQEIIEKAENEDFTLLKEIKELLKKPYDEQPESEKWFSKRPAWISGTSMLSCSS